MFILFGGVLGYVVITCSYSVEDFNEIIVILYFGGGTAFLGGEVHFFLGVAIVSKLERDVYLHYRINM